MAKITIEIDDEELLTKKETKIGEDGRIFIGRGYAGQEVVVYVLRKKQKQ